MPLILLMHMLKAVPLRHIMTNAFGNNKTSNEVDISKLNVYTPFPKLLNSLANGSRDNVLSNT